MSKAMHQDDLDLVDAVLRGEIDAWHRFIDEKSGVIIAVLRRYLFDEDELRTVYVDVLSKLRKSQLATYEGRSALTTWLTLVARGAAADHLRARFGRREEPAGLADLPPRSRTVYQLYYIEGLAFEDVRMRVKLGPDESLAEVLAEIEDKLTNRTLRRIAWDLHATSVGGTTGRLLEYLEVTSEDMQRQGRELEPDALLIRQEAQRTLERVRQLMADLPAEERQVLELRFDEGWTADRIAEEMALPGRRRVYTIADRALARLRRWMGMVSLLVFFFR